ncbi:MAG: phosphoribosylglycinamide formyltransferase [Flavobacteriaceae bacterium]
MQKKIVILASGNGSNAEKIIRRFHSSSEVNVLSILSNNRQAGVFDKAKSFGIPCLWVDKNFFKSEQFLSLMSAFNPDLIVLAGFLWKIPEALVQNFPQKIINIHPSLLPKYGGKGMYGAHVHQAVKDSGDDHSGITIHYVNEYYDQGAVIFQAKVKIDVTDGVVAIAEKVHQLEHKHFPEVIEKILKNKS